MSHEKYLMCSEEFLLAGGEETDLPFEFLRTGTFTDMFGRELAITADVLESLTANFESRVYRQDVPIDISHRFDEAAGWVRSVEHSGDKLLAAPDWNELGRELVGDRRYRYVSAAFRLEPPMLLAISLTNFPAVKNLKPLALAEGDGADFVYVFSEGESPMGANAQNPEAAASTSRGARTEVQAPAEQPAAPPAEQPVEKPVTPPVAQAPPAPPPVTPAPSPPPTEKPSPPPATPPSVDVEALTARIHAELKAEFEQRSKDRESALLTQVQQILAGELQKVEDAKLSAVAEAVKQLRENEEIRQMALRLTSTGKHALPVTPDVMEGLLRAPTRETVTDLLQVIYTNGLVSFEEAGTAAPGKMETRPPLDSAIAGYLKAHIKDGGDIEQFFAANKNELGSMDDYDLSQFHAAA